MAVTLKIAQFGMKGGATLTLVSGQIGEKIPSASSKQSPNTSKKRQLLHTLTLEIGEKWSNLVTLPSIKELNEQCDLRKSCQVLQKWPRMLHICRHSGQLLQLCK